MFRALLCFLVLFAKLAVVTPVIAQPNAAETEFWENIKTVKNPTVLEAYLEAYLQLYPDGEFASQARVRLQKLNQQSGGAGGKPAKAEAKQKPKIPEPGSKTADGAPPVHECDRLAAHPFDPDKKTEGLFMANMDGNAATKACREALKAYPGTTRFEMQLGRALSKAKSYTNSVIYYRKAAKKGNAHAMYGVALSYWYGRGVKKNRNEAVRWYRKASDRGNPAAMANLGNLYRNGSGGVEKNLLEAVRWYRKAADKGYAPAMYNLGVHYERGLGGVSQDHTEAVRWYRKAAEKGFAFAMNALGAAYQKGRGVGKDRTEAIKWYRKAADKGHEQAKEYLKNNVEK